MLKKIQYYIDNIYYMSYNISNNNIIRCIILLQGGYIYGI